MCCVRVQGGSTCAPRRTSQLNTPPPAVMPPTKVTQGLPTYVYVNCLPVMALKWGNVASILIALPRLLRCPAAAT